MVSPSHARIEERPPPEPINETDERPPEAITRTLVAKWREMEVTNAPAPLPRTPAARARSSSRGASVERSRLSMSTVPDPVEQQVRVEDELPPAAIAKNLINKLVNN